MTAMNHDNIKAAVQLLGAYTGQSFDIGRLAGPAARSHRAQVLSTLRGEKIPASNAGINAIREAFFAALAPAGGCLAVQAHDFVAKCRELLAG